MPSFTDSPHPVIALRGVSKSYREGATERTVLSHIDFEVQQGQLVVLLGKSGSGKSTLLNLISGMDVPTAGEVMLSGKPLHKLSEEARTLVRRQSIGFVFQSFNLIPTLTVEENVMLPRELQGERDDLARERARALLEQVGLGDRRDSYPDRLSGGEQQRVAIARAVSHEPALLLADEPTGNLDEETGRAVMDLLDRVCRQQGRTMLVVTHDREMSRRADRTFDLIRGELTLRPQAPTR